VREERQARLRSLGVADESWALSLRDSDVPAWADLESVQKEDMDRRMAIYAAQIDCMDQGIGRLVSTLEKTGQMENTLILFLSDNGASHERILRGEKGRDVLGTDRSYESYRRGWANASNTPFRLFKHWVHEGGIATPLIVQWPARVKDRGQWRVQPGHVIDILPTLIGLAGASYPSEHKGGEIIPVEGKSLVPTLANQNVEREALFWEHESNRAIRVGNWKLVADGLEGPWELYDLGSDRTELNDLAPKERQRVKELAEKWQHWAERANVLPLDDRGWFERLEGGS
jgi:arylsulfatase